MIAALANLRTSIVCALAASIPLAVVAIDDGAVQEVALRPAPIVEDAPAPIAKSVENPPPRCAQGQRGGLCVEDPDTGYFGRGRSHCFDYPAPNKGSVRVR